MTILVSACLLGISCKYSGGSNDSEAVRRFVQGHHIVPICPEQLGGLPTPRVPCERCGDRVLNRDGADVTEAFCRGAEAACRLAEITRADLAILQPRSPSCGVGTIYDGTFSGTRIPGNGITAQALLQMGLTCIPADQLDALSPT